MEVTKDEPAATGTPPCVPDPLAVPATAVTTRQMLIKVEDKSATKEEATESSEPPKED